MAVEQFSVDLFAHHSGKHSEEPDCTVVIECEEKDLLQILSRGRYRDFCSYDAFDNTDHWVFGKNCKEEE